MRRAIATGVLGAALASGWACRDSQRLMSLVTIFLFGLKYVLISLLGCAAGLLIGYAVFGRTAAIHQHRRQITSLFASAALLPALFLCVDVHARWTFVPASALALVISTLMRRPEWSMGKSLAVSVILQIGVLLLMVGDRTTPAPFFAIAAGAIAVGMRPRFRLHISTAVVAALLFTTAALFIHLTWAKVPETGNVEASTRVDPDLPPEPGAPSHTEFDDTHPGIIIWPELEKKTKLVTPLPALKRIANLIHPSEPFDIPFNGVYWIFRYPQVQPPKNSLVIRGNPAKRVFRSTDRIPLTMQARQNFGDYISVACCRSIDVQVTSADWFSSTVTLELRLRDSGRKSEQSLGRELIAQQTSTISYALSSRKLDRFDEVVLVFHLQPIRAAVAPKISVDRLIFKPN